MQETVTVDEHREQEKNMDPVFTSAMSRPNQNQDLEVWF